MEYVRSSVLLQKLLEWRLKTIFTSADVPAYHAYDSLNCPMCQKGERVEALVNSFGYSKLRIEVIFIK